jgi:hypothetical protein
MTASAVIKIYCSDACCSADTTLICAVVVPKGWGEKLGYTDIEGNRVPSRFWCPAHAPTYCGPEWISDGRP